MKSKGLVKRLPEAYGWATGDDVQVLYSWPGASVMDKVTEYYQRKQTMMEVEDEDEIEEPTDPKEIERLAAAQGFGGDFLKGFPSVQ